jgi:ElaA protein
MRRRAALADRERGDMEARVQLIWTRFADFTVDELYAALAFRQAVLVVEQNSPYADLDSLDHGASHLRAVANTELVGYARCHGPTDIVPHASFGRLVVAPEYRRTGLGREMVREILTRLVGHRCDFVIGAQLYLQKFYSTFGFIVDGEPYDDTGVRHVRMRLTPANWRFDG